MAFFGAKTKIVFIGILSCLLFTSCAVNSTKTPQAISVEPESAVKSMPVKAQQVSSPIEDTTIKNNEKVIESWEDYEASNLPLLSALPHRGIFLYAKKPEGVILHAGDNEQYFDWPHLTPRFILPRMEASDFDADGKDELSVVLYIGSGTGVSIEDLHIVEIPEGGIPTGSVKDKLDSGCFKDHVFSPEDYISQLRSAVKFKTFTRAGELMGEIKTDTGTYKVSLKDFQTKDFGKINDDVVLGSIVRFNPEKSKLKAEFAVGITSESFASPSYIGVIHSDVYYKDGEFKLENFRFEENH